VMFTYHAQTFQNVAANEQNSIRNDGQE